MTTPAIDTRTTGLLRRELHTGWTVRAASGPFPDSLAGVVIPATVPGVVHLDLLAAGLIPDPYLDDNEALLAWIGLTDWTYETTFAVTADELAAHRVHDLVFDGIDTVATVSLNGTVLREVANQHRSYRIDVTDSVRVGENTLSVAFRSPVKYADEQSLALGARPRPYPTPYEAIRKSACSFGWDWGISTATSGLWRAVALESWSVARLAEVRVVATPEGDGGQVEAVVRVQREPGSDAALAVTLAVAGEEASGTLAAGVTEATVVVDLAAAERWWPAGHGAQPLYDVTVALADAGERGAGESGAGLDAAARRVGFRTLRWNTEPDASGTPFQLIVNDRPVFVKGVNWIPDDALFPRVDRARYARRLTQARDAHLNLVRVWGGGIYESDDFYDLCDELGLLTWQDFLFACAAYPEEEPIRSEVEAEARENITRIAHHASLALLTGNNENLWGYEEWGWKRVLDGATWGAYYYYELFPYLAAELAPHVMYAPGSPFSPGGAHPNDVQHGTMHLWEQWNRLDYPTYRDQTPRFVAEFGWQGPPAWTTLTRSISDAPLTPESPGMIVHQKAAEGNAKLASGLVDHYRVPRDMVAWHWAMQLNQANAVTCALEWFRSHEPFTSGAIVWQLNDCWPVTSWAAIDGDEREKPLYFALRNAFAPRVVIVTPREGGLSVTIGNDTDDAWSGELVVTRRGFDGAERGRWATGVDAAPRASATVTLPADIAEPADAADEVLVAELDGVRTFWFFAEPRDSRLAAAEFDVSIADAADGVAEVRVTAHSLIRDLALLVDLVDPAATVESGLVTLLPGDSHVFTVAGASRVDADLVRAALRSGNDLVAA